MHSQRSSLLPRMLGLGLGAAVSLMLWLPGCLGRSGLGSPALEPPDGGVAGGSGGSAGSGGSGGSAGSAGSGGSAGFAGSAGLGGGAGSGGSGGSAGSAGSGGGSGSGGTGGAPGCGAQSCKGCCDVAGNCRGGGAVNACGLGGVTCIDCGAIGFGCTGGACGGPPPKCGPSNCKGCCDATGLCRFGTGSDACGLGGISCANCTATSEGCVSGKCQGPPPPKCGPSNCGGCCDASGVCRTGNSDASCGSAGQACVNCSAQGRICTQPGSYCAFVPSCGFSTCPSGCCDAQGNCRSGNTNTDCGDQGQKCVDCTQSGQACAAQGFCYAGQHCGPDNCAGCCTATGQCRNGSSSLRCGEFGALCDNCSAKSETCQNQVCSNGSTCPAAYPGCSPTSLTPPPKTSTSCSSSELTALALACKGNPVASSCSPFFQKLLSSDPSCYDCLLQFTGNDAYTRCLAPYLTSSCNHNLTCATDCSNSSCQSCSAGQQDQCSSDVFGSGGQCSPWVSGYYCAQAAISGPASFCDFPTGGDVGKWLATVGKHYCGG